MLEAVDIYFGWSDFSFEEQTYNRVEEAKQPATTESTTPANLCQKQVEDTPEKFT